MPFCSFLLFVCGFVCSVMVLTSPVPFCFFLSLGGFCCYFIWRWRGIALPFELVASADVVVGGWFSFPYGCGKNSIFNISKREARLA